MELCVFQGTFNPIHTAHIKIAEYAIEKYNFDKIIFIPAANPPHKETDKNLKYHRLNMVKLATENNIRFEVDDIEYKREGKSYTYLTILELRKKFNINNKIHFLIGTDAFEKIESWYETDKLKEVLHFIVFPRIANYDRKKLELLKENGYDFELTDMKIIDISSTDIRNNVKNIEIPKVMEYIKEHGLYKMA